MARSDRIDKYLPTMQDIHVEEYRFFQSHELCLLELRDILGPRTSGPRKHMDKPSRVPETDLDNRGYAFMRIDLLRLSRQ